METGINIIKKGNFFFTWNLMKIVFCGINLRRWEVVGCIAADT